MTNSSAAHTLIEGIRDGDVSALATLYGSYAHMVRAVASRILRNSSDADDVAQEVFLQVWRQAAMYDPARGSVEGWLSTITRSRAIDRRRRTWRYARHEEACDRLEHVHVRSRSGDDQLIDEESGRAVWQALDALPAAQRVAVELGFVEGLTHPEIADVLYQPLGTVKSRIRLGLQRMRARVQERSSDVPTHEPSPFSESLAAYLARTPIGPKAYRRLDGLRMLAVDDDADTLDLLRTVLESAGGTVTTARSASGALAELKAAWPTVLIADLSMPGDDGYWLLQRARALSENTGRPLIAVAFTALGPRERVNAIRAGFAEHLAKPVQPHLLLEIIVRLSGTA